MAKLSLPFTFYGFGRTNVWVLFLSLDYQRMSGMGEWEGGVGILDDEVRTEVRTLSRVRTVTVHHPASDAGVSPMVSGELWPSCRQSLPGRRPDSVTRAARYKDI